MKSHLLSLHCCQQKK